MIFTPHWPSRLRDVYLPISTITERLRVDVESESESESETINNIVLLGDYNVEPYDKRIVHHLQSSREKELVLTRTCRFLSFPLSNITETNHHAVSPVW